MTREKQIEEIQEEIIRWGENADRTGNYGYALSEHLVDQGYRKADEVAREIFEEIDDLLYRDERDYDDLMDSETVAEIYQEYLACSNYICGARKEIAELKKKYTEMEKENGI